MDGAPHDHPRLPCHQRRQTRKIARQVMHRLSEAGHAVELLPLRDAADIDLSRYDRAVFAAKVPLEDPSDFALAQPTRFHE